MPTYDYECAACGQRFEQFQSITAAPIRKCPLCGKRKARRLIGTGGGIIFKGSGFYQTDYRSESYRKAAEKDKGGASSGTDKKDTSGGAPKAADSAKKEPAGTKG